MFVKGWSVSSAMQISSFYTRKEGTHIFSIYPYIYRYEWKQLLKTPPAGSVWVCVASSHQCVAPCLVEVRIRAVCRGEIRVRWPHTRWQQQIRRRAVDKEFVQPGKTLFVYGPGLEEYCCWKQKGFLLQRFSFSGSGAKQMGSEILVL